MVNYFMIMNKFSIDKALKWGLEDFSVLYCSLTNVPIRKMHTLQIEDGRASGLGTTWVKVVG